MEGCSNEKIKKICKKFNLKLFEDSAQALGAKYKKTFAGNFGEGGVFSFYPAKILGCFGDGGAVITNKKKIYDKLKLLRDHGRLNGYVKLWGFNGRTTVFNFVFYLKIAVIIRKTSFSKIYSNGYNVKKD